MLGAVLVDRDHLPLPARPALDAHHLHLDSDLDHRHVRPALLRRLHAEHDDVRRPGARRRHDRRRVDRRAGEHLPAHGARARTAMQASIDGSEEVWSAILASTLTHIAVFVPLLFLTGVSSILFKQLAIVVMFSLSMSLFVAVTIVPVLCSRISEACRCTASRAARSRRPLVHLERAVARRHGRGLPPACSPCAAPPARRSRPRRRRSWSLAVLILPTIGFELMPQADEGEVSVDGGAAGRHAHRARAGRGAAARVADRGATCPRRRSSSRRRAAAASRRRSASATQRHDPAGARRTSARAPASRSRAI